MGAEVEIAKNIERPKQGQKYSPAQVDQILLQLIENGGVLKKTHEQTGVSMTTLSKWRSETHVERYNELLRSHGNELKVRSMAVARQRIQEFDATQKQFLDRLEQMAEDPDLSPGDASKAMDALTRAKKAEHEALASMENRPTIVQHEFNADRTLDTLRKLGMPIPKIEVVEATAEEIAE